MKPNFREAHPVAARRQTAAKRISPESWRLSPESRYACVAASRQSAALFPRACFPIPKGLCHSAQGCEERATLGTSAEDFPTLKGLRHEIRPEPQPRWGWPDFSRLTQGSSCLATLGFKPESRWDSASEFPDGNHRRFVKRRYASQSTLALTSGERAGVRASVKP